MHIIYNIYNIMSFIDDGCVAASAVWGSLALAISIPLPCFARQVKPLVPRLTGREELKWVLTSRPSLIYFEPWALQCCHMQQNNKSAVVSSAITHTTDVNRDCSVEFGKVCVSKHQACGGAHARRAEETKFNLWVVDACAA